MATEQPQENQDKKDDELSSLDKEIEGLKETKRHIIEKNTRLKEKQLLEEQLEPVLKPKTWIAKETGREFLNAGKKIGNGLFAVGRFLADNKGETCPECNHGKQMHILKGGTAALCGVMIREPNTEPAIFAYCKCDHYKRMAEQKPTGQREQG